MGNDTGDSLRAETRSGVYKALVIPVFLIVLVAPLLMFWFQPASLIQENMEEERRQFSNAPKLSGDLKSLNGFPLEFERYFRDRFGFRRSLVTLYANLKYRVLGDAPRRDYLVGKNGWFFRGYGAMRVEPGVTTSFDAVSDYLGQVPFSKEELEQWKQVLEERRQFVESQGGVYIFAVSPTKQMIYPEFFPDRLRARKGVSRGEQLTAYLKKHVDVAVVDLYAAMKKAKELRKSPYLYYKTDLHWNRYGAFVAYKALIDRAVTLLPRLKIRPTALGDYRIRYRRGWKEDRFVATFGVEITETTPDLVPRKRTRRARQVRHFRFRLFPKEPKRWVEYDNPNHTELSKVLLYGDSFLARTARYFSHNSRRTYYRRAIIAFPRDIFQTERRPQLVVQTVMADFLLSRSLVK